MLFESGLALCLKTRNPTSGGVLIKGMCAIKNWSASQTAVELSTAEAELYGDTRIVSEAKALKSRGKDFGEDLRIAAWVDAQATMATPEPQSSGLMILYSAVNTSLGNLAGRAIPPTCLPSPYLGMSWCGTRADWGLTVYSRPATHNW